MTKNEMMGFAAEAGLWVTSVERLKAVEKFTELVEAAEREACAKVAENGRFLHDDSPEARFGKSCAAAIRARGQE